MPYVSNVFLFYIAYVIYCVMVLSMVWVPAEVSYKARYETHSVRVGDSKDTFMGSQKVTLLPVR